MLEEIAYQYKITKIDLDKGEQFKPEFKKISPLSKIPVIIDHNKNKTIFESGAILIYLAEESGMFYEKKIDWILISGLWLKWVMLDQC